MLQDNSRSSFHGFGSDPETGGALVTALGLLTRLQMLVERAAFARLGVGEPGRRHTVVIKLMWEHLRQHACTGTYLKSMDMGLNTVHALTV
jgi:hypothetical protein